MPEDLAFRSCVFFHLGLMRTPRSIGGNMPGLVSSNGDKIPSAVSTLNNRKHKAPSDGVLFAADGRKRENMFRIHLREKLCVSGGNALVGPWSRASPDGDKSKMVAKLLCETGRGRGSGWTPSSTGPSPGTPS